MEIDLSGWEVQSSERAFSPDQDTITLRIGRKVSSESKIPNLLNLAHAHAFLQICQFHTGNSISFALQGGAQGEDHALKFLSSTKE